MQVHECGVQSRELHGTKTVARHDSSGIRDRRATRGDDSLEEGIEQTLTLHKLGVEEEMRQRLRTANTMKNIDRTMQERLRRIRRSVNSDQYYHWVAMVLVEAEKGIKKIEYIDQLVALQKA